MTPSAGADGMATPFQLVQVLGPRTAVTTREASGDGRGAGAGAAAAAAAAAMGAMNGSTGSPLPRPYSVHCCQSAAPMRT